MPIIVITAHSGKQVERIDFGSPHKWLRPDAIAAERQLKGWRRAKKEALIRGDFEVLQELAKNYADRWNTSLRPSTADSVHALFAREPERADHEE